MLENHSQLSFVVYTYLHTKFYQYYIILYYIILYDIIARAWVHTRTRARACISAPPRLFPLDSDNDSDLATRSRVITRPAPSGGARSRAGMRKRPPASPAETARSRGLEIARRSSLSVPGWDGHRKAPPPHRAAVSAGDGGAGAGLGLLSGPLAGLLRLGEGTRLMIYCVSVPPNHSGSACQQVVVWGLK